MIRNSLLVKMHDALSVQGYKSDDFDVETNRDDSGISATIRYRFDRRFRAIVHVRTVKPLIVNPLDPDASTQVGDIILTTYPGEILDVERRKVDGDEELLEELGDWVARLHEELTSEPERREGAARRRQVEDLIAQVEDAPDEPFAPEEVATFREQLDRLEVQLTESIRQHTEHKEDADRQIAALHQDVALLKEQLELLSKANWKKSVAVRMVTWMTDPTTAAMIKSGMNLLRLLPGSDGASPE